MTKGYANKKCMDCCKLVRRTWKTKGKFLCQQCYSKYMHITQCRPPKIKLEEALNRTYVIKKYKTSSCIAAFPSILAGYKFKIQLIEKKLPQGLNIKRVSRE